MGTQPENPTKVDVWKTRRRTGPGHLRPRISADPGQSVLRETRARRTVAGRTRADAAPSVDPEVCKIRPHDGDAQLSTNPWQPAASAWNRGIEMKLTDGSGWRGPGFAGGLCNYAQPVGSRGEQVFVVTGEQDLSGAHLGIAKDPVSQESLDAAPFAPGGHPRVEVAPGFRGGRGRADGIARCRT